MPILQLMLVIFAEPFLPFVIYLADGRVLVVPHPEFIGLSGSKRAITVYHANGDTEIVALSSVTSLRITASQRENKPPI